MSKPNLTANRPPVPRQTAAPSIDAHLFDTPKAKPVQDSAVPAIQVGPDSPRGEELATRITFSNQLKPDVYVMLRQYEHHAEVEVQQILDEALRAFLTDKPQAQQPLPPKAAAKVQEKLRKK